jgi:hypothetical protein
MNSSFTFNFMNLNFPEPGWKSKVERWYQIDPPSFALCESYWQNQDFLKDAPDLILLNSPQASFKTDQNFCKTLSPSKFVHTLPNVRTSALFQLIPWRGPMMSFVGDFSQTLSLAQEMSAATPGLRIWAIHVKEVPHLSVEWHVLPGGPT